MLSRCVFSAIALLSLGTCGVCEFSFSARTSEAIELWDVQGVTGDYFQNYLLTSASAEVDSNSAQGDLFVASLSSFVYPAVTYAYFDVKADYNLSTHRAHAYSYEVGASATGIATLWSKLFQFIDVDKDGAYTEGVDGIVNEYSLKRASWDSGEFSSENKTMKIKTKDGVFAVTLEANENVSTLPGGSTLTPMNTKVDIEMNYNNYKELQAGNLVGLETYIVTTTAADLIAGESAIRKASQGLYVEQPGSFPMLGYTWDGEATSVSEGSTMHLSEIERADAICRGIGVTATVDAYGLVEVQKMNFVFNQNKTGSVKTHQSVGSAFLDDDLLSGASGVARWATMLLALFLSAASVSFNAAH